MKHNTYFLKGADGKDHEVTEEILGHKVITCYINIVNSSRLLSK